MIEAFGHHLETDAIFGALDIPKGLAQGVGSVVPLKVDGPAPSFDQVVHAGHGQRVVLSLGV